MNTNPRILSMSIGRRFTDALPAPTAPAPLHVGVDWRVNCWRRPAITSPADMVAPLAIRAPSIATGLPVPLEMRGV